MTGVQTCALPISQPANEHTPITAQRTTATTKNSFFFIIIPLINLIIEKIFITNVIIYHYRQEFKSFPKSFTKIYIIIDIIKKKAPIRLNRRFLFCLIIN